MSEAEMFSGTVRWFDPVKGYGAITPADGGADVFVSQRAVDQSGVERLEGGMVVTYRVATQNGRPGAVDIVVVE